MKNKFLTLVALAAAAMTTACSGDTLATDAEQQPQEPQTVSLTASVGGDNTTRVGMSRDNGKVSFYWHAGDKITMHIKKKDDPDYLSYEHFKIATDTETGAKTATFKGQVSAGHEVGTYALYPADGGHDMALNKFGFYLEPSYSYRTVDSNIFPKTTDGVTTYPQNSIRMPMLGTISNGNISFKHLGGVLLIRVDKMPTESGTIVVSADQRLWGTYLIQDPESSTPYIASSLLSSSSADGDHLHTVTFNYSGATVGGVGVFYLPVPTGEYTNIKINVNGVTAEFGSLNVDRGDVITIPVYQGTDGTSYGCDYVVNGHKFIDLCLPSGTLWAETNVGATNAADYGNYYAWGEVTAYGEAKDFDDYTVKTCYDWDNYKYGTGDNKMTKYYLGSSPTLESSDDAAYVNWGSFCRMPSRAELNELFNDSYTTRAWTTQTDSNGNNINGAMITSKKNGKTIFLPAAGYYLSSTYLDGVPNYTYGGYWSNSLNGFGNSSDYASICSFTYWSSTSKYKDDGDGTGERRAGYPVRPVAKTYSTMSSSGSSVADMSTSGFDSTWE